MKGYTPFMDEKEDSFTKHVDFKNYDFTSPCFLQDSMFQKDLNLNFELESSRCEKDGMINFLLH